MQVHFGWGTREVRFVPAEGNIMAHVAWKHIERGGYDASPTGISYHWHSEPERLPALIAELQEVHQQYLAWVEQTRSSTSPGDM